MHVLRLLAAAWLGCLLLAVTAGSPAAAAGDYAAVARLDGVINPPAASYVDRAIASAEKDGAAVLVLQLDTPGGLDSSMRLIVQRILASAVPVIVYVAPAGARDASAGVYITYSAQLAAMAPNTNIGSATPVSLGQNGEQQMSDEMRNKVTNDAVAYIRGLAAERGRNADWAEDAVRQAVNVPAQDALQLGVVNYVAADVPDLLRQADGARVATPSGEVTLHTAGLPVRAVEMQPQERLLHAITDPTIAYLLLSLGSLALIYELANPGAILPGVAGGLALLLALYALGTLPVNLAGVLLILFAMGLFAFDLVAPTHGAATVGGVAAFVLGSAILYNTPESAPYLALAPQVIALVTLFLSLFFGALLGTALRTQYRRPVTGREHLLGLRGEVRAALAPDGLVFVAGELWSARSDGETIPVGAIVEVLAVDGLRLRVRQVAPPAIATPPHGRPTPALRA
ncbi:MAG TPA: nodulation protein NfeD [Chloroflexota bacterium]|nr:nodulation protein NfeD [Chloroflexota bacterium]